ncbi:MAG: DegV family protein [Lachnospiraceae bacterium]|nr:DegV family protein [Lachnospiraceae bacterium]
MAVKIITDGACDLETEFLKRCKVACIPFYISFDGETYKKEKVEMGVRKFYQQMIDEPEVFPKTSLPAVNDYIDVLEPLLNNGDEVICICFTSHLSGAYNAALNAKMILEEEYPDAKLSVINSMCATVTQASFVIEAIKMRDAGLAYEEIVAHLERIKTDAKIFFTIENLDYLIHGGRIGKMAGRAGTALKLKPLIILDKGEVTSGGIARSRKKSMTKVIDMMADYFTKEGKNINDFVLNVGFGYDEEEGKIFLEKVKEKAQELGYQEEIPLMQIGATIAVHTGPGALGIGVVPKYNA